MLRSFFYRPKTVRVPVKNGQVEIQQVQVTNRTKPLISRFFSTLIITYCVVNTISWIASDDFKRKSDTARSQIDGLRKEQEKARKTKQQSEHWKKQHANIAKTSAPGTSGAITDDSQDFHLTLPIWFRKRKQRLHTLKDREWQDAKELMRDKKALTTLKQKTAQTVMAGCKQRSNILHWLSFIQFDGRVGAEFDIAPQMFTPVTYEVPCIFVKSDQIDIGWRPLSASSGGRIERTFHPVIFAKAFYAGIKAFTLTSFTITTSRLKKAVSTPSELRVEVSAKNTGTSPSTGPQANPTSGRPLTDQQSPTKAASPDPSKSLSLLKPGDHILSWKAHQARAQSMTYKEALDNARKVFKQQWIARQVLAVQRQTPGLCMIVGTVTCMGKKGKLRLNVTAFYSPSEKAFVGLPNITGHLVVPNLPLLEDVEKQRSAPQLTTQKQHPPGPVPEKQSVQPAPSEEAAPPPPEGKDATK